MTGDTGKEIIQRERRLKESFTDAALLVALPLLLTASLIAATLWVWYASGETCTTPDPLVEVCRWITPEILRDLIQNSAFAIAIGAAGDWLMFNRLTRERNEAIKERNEALRIANKREEEAEQARQQAEQARQQAQQALEQAQQERELARQEREQSRAERAQLLEMLKNRNGQS